MTHETGSLAHASDDLANAPLAGYAPLLAKRRLALEKLAASPDPPRLELASALRSGRDARARLVVELAGLRSQVDELRRLRTGLEQLRPKRIPSRSLDVRL